MKKIAILIAVEKYMSKSIPEVEYARNDVEAFSDALAMHGFDKNDQLVLVDANATKAIIESRVMRAIKRLSEDDILYFYYAGHGFSKANENYITCYDTHETDLKGTSVALELFFKELQNSRCEKIALFLDCCESGIKATTGMRSIYDSLQQHELEEFLDDTKHCVCFAACRTDESSYPSGKLMHGIWTYHLIEAFKGDAHLALQRGLLVSSSLQNYLKSEVPITLRKTYTDGREQTPWTYGASSGDFLLADLNPILKARKAAAQQGSSLVTDVSFVSKEVEQVRRLSGFKKSHRVPDNISGATENFIAKISADDLKYDLDKIYDSLKEAFGFGRRELDVSDTDGGAASIITPYFNYSISVSLNPDDPSEVIWHRTVDSIKDPSYVASDAFGEVFDGMFDTLEYSLPTSLKLEQFIDSIEASEIDGLSIDYDREVTFCILRFDQLAGSVRITPDTLSVTHAHGTETKVLIQSLNNVRRLALQLDVPLLSFSPPSQK